MRCFLKHPKTNEPDMLMTLAWVVSLVSCAKFLFEGVEIPFGTHMLSLGHADAATYAALLAPILGAHGWRESSKTPRQAPPAKVDNPDG